MNYFSFCKFPHYYNGERLSTASGSELFLKEKNNLSCCCCGLKAKKWIGYTQINSYPVLNLYGIDSHSKEILFTRDHIIPKSIGGSENVLNLRVMCADCNHKRKAEMTKEELQFAVDNFEKLFIHERTFETIKRILSRLQSGKMKTEEATQNYQNISQLFKSLKEQNRLPETHTPYEPILDKIKNILELSA